MAVGDVTANTIENMQILRDRNEVYATQVTGQIQDMVNGIAAIVGDIDPDWDSRLGYSVPRVPNDVQFGHPAGAPANFTFDQAKAFMDLGANIPKPYIPNSIGTISPMVAPPLPGAAPQVNFDFAAPDATLPADVENIEITLPQTFTISDIVIPDPPDLDNVLLIPIYDDLSITPYTYVADTFDISPDSLARFNYSEQEYTSSLKTLAEQRIYDMLSASYSAIYPEVEAALYARAQERELEAQRLNLLETADTFAASGFPQPPGALRAKMARIRSEMTSRAESLSREILIKQADLAQDTAKFMLDKSLASIAMNLEHFNKVADRALQVAKASVEYSVTIFNAQAQAFNLNLEHLKAGAAIHEANIRIMLQSLEANKLEIERAKLAGELRAQNLQEYQLKLQTLDTGIKLHNARIDQSKMLIDGERAKIDVFRSQVDAYIAKVKAKESEFGIYTARLGAEESKLRGYATEVQLYTTKVDAEKSRIGAEKELLSAKVMMEISRQDAKRLEIEVYKAQLQRNMQAAAAMGEKYRADATYWSSAIALSEAKAQVGVANMNVEAEVNKFAAQQANQSFQAQMQAFIELTKMQIDGPTASMNALGNIAAATLSQTTSISQALSGVTTIESGDEPTPTP